jgi:hypothetical protein
VAYVEQEMQNLLKQVILSFFQDFIIKGKLFVALVRE